VSNFKVIFIIYKSEAPVPDNNDVKNQDFWEILVLRVFNSKMCIIPVQFYFGPAFRTSSLGKVNCVKFFLKRSARFAAC
jgi:hypothetical protein